MYNDPNQPQQTPPPYEPTVAATPPPYGQPQQAPPPYGQPQQVPPSVPTSGPKRSRRGCWIAVIAVVLVLLIGGVIGVLVLVNLPTPTKVLTAYCNALKAGDYKTAYNQYTSTIQGQLGPESDFATFYSGFGKVTNCTVGNVDSQNQAPVTMTFDNGLSLTYDNQVASNQINYQKLRSTPEATLLYFCNNLTLGDYQSAYSLLSNTMQGQVGTQDKFATFAKTTLKSCKASNVNDGAGTGTVTYNRTDGNIVTADDKLVNDNGTWKIDSQQFRSTPTETLLDYCGALLTQDYQTAYNQLSSTAQSQETEAQFAATFAGVQLKDCAVSNVNNTAGTGTITYTATSGTTAVADYTLVQENGVWKIDTEKVRS